MWKAELTSCCGYKSRDCGGLSVSHNLIFTCFFCVICFGINSGVLFKTIFFIRGAGFVLDMWGKTDKSAVGKRGGVCLSVTIREMTTNKVTKHVVPAFCTSSLLYPLKAKEKRGRKIFSGFRSISPFFTCGMSCIGNLSVHYLLLFMKYFTFPRYFINICMIFCIWPILRNLLSVPLWVKEEEEE